VEKLSKDLGYAKVCNFSDDLSDGAPLLQVLLRVAPEVAAAVLPARCNAIDDRVKAILDIGKRCGTPFVLNKEAVLEGQEDLLSAFVASLFLARPCLSALPGSPLFEHLATVEEVIDAANAATISKSDPNRGRDSENMIQKLIKALGRDDGKAFRGAMDAAMVARDQTDRIEERLQAFIFEVYNKRVTSQPQRHYHAEFNDCTTRERFMELLKLRSWRECMHDEHVGVLGARVITIIRPRLTFVVELFKYYSQMSNSTHELAVPYEGFRQMYKDCNLNCPCVRVPPETLETLFYEVLALKDTSPSPEREGLNELGFLKCLLRVAVLRMDYGNANGPKAGFRENLKRIFTDHLQPHAFQVSEDEFERLVSNRGVWTLFDEREHLLRGIFKVYAREPDDGSLGETSAEPPPASTAMGSMRCDDFEALLRDAGVMTGPLLNHEAVRSIIGNASRRSLSSAVRAKAGRSCCSDGMTTSMRRALSAPPRLHRAPVKVVEAVHIAPKRARAALRMKQAVRLGRSKTRSGLSPPISPKSIVRALSPGGRSASPARSVSPALSESPSPTISQAAKWMMGQRGPVARKATFDRRTSMGFDEFWEALVAVMLYRFPCPLHPLRQRMESFLFEVFFKGLASHTEELLENEPEELPSPEAVEARTRAKKLALLFQEVRGSDEPKAELSKSSSSTAWEQSARLARMTVACSMAQQRRKKRDRCQSAPPRVDSGLRMAKNMTIASKVKNILKTMKVTSKVVLLGRRRSVAKRP